MALVPRQSEAIQSESESQQIIKKTGKTNKKNQERGPKSASKSSSRAESDSKWTEKARGRQRSAGEAAKRAPEWLKKSQRPQKTCKTKGSPSLT